ncbi:helix-turn-helix transcriptional regulator [Cellulomonas aerilata]|uniref:Transcriptional regulator n=1 Tax=Cellulomonas aerilata TaxID=515326 RepID=A0A512DFY4_9CELL|nr:helix-turn-helix transcriptional regulator [Cellulomonas aerilata]GEO35387.1 transcriptional regulator [Cellulomonas aerilata]
MVGRDRELAVLQALVDRAREGSPGTLVVTGEAGIGKTTLLDAAAARAEGFVRLRGHGVESEATLAHVALLELLAPLRHLLPELPDPQADALAGALGWGRAVGPGDPYLVAAATLSVLAAAASAAPVLVLVDDLHWVDRESAAALLFAARRLRHDPVVFLLATRTGHPAAVPLDGADALALEGLPASSAASLLGGRLADGVARRLAERTHGNPLALTEAAERLTPAQRVGAAPLPDPLPVGARLATAYERLLAGLSAPARTAVLLCAAGGGSHPAAPVEALRRLVDDPGTALDEAEAAGVLVRSDGELRFRHPLLRTAAWQAATGAERRHAHRALADALPGDAARAARTWHLAEAAAGPDDDLATELAAVAQLERTRRGYASSSAALQRAAALSTAPDRAADLLAGAVGDAFLAGDLERTRTLGRRVLDGPAGRGARGQALGTLGTLEQYAGSVPRAADLLAAAAQEAEGAALTQVLAELALTRFRLNDLAGMVDCADRIARAADPADVEQRLLSAFVRGVARTVTGDPLAGRPLLAEVLTLLERPELRDDPRYLLHLGLAVGFLGEADPAAVEASAERRLARARQQGALGLLVPGLAIIAAGRAGLGDHRAAFADAGEAAELGEQLGYAADTSVAVEMLAWQSAARGLHDDARQALARARALIDRAGTTAVAVHHSLTAAFCALTAGDAAEVVALLEPRLAADGGVGSMAEPLGVAPDLVEAYLALGRTDDARTLARRFAAVTPPGAAPVTTALVARCAALTAADVDAAVTAFELALAAHGQGLDAFDGARTRLLYGSALRRAGRRVAAREQLGTARDTFAAMDLTAWERRAAAELAATGATARRTREPAAEPLTSQETRVALLVARGLSNRDVAAALFLSPRTVEHHLTSVFRKRGYRSRAQVAAAFAQGPPAADRP